MANSDSDPDVQILDNVQPKCPNPKKKKKKKKKRKQKKKKKIKKRKYPIQPSNDSPPPQKKRKINNDNHNINNINNDEDLCNVCLEPKKDSESISSLESCIHTFHKACIQLWFQVTPFSTCPTCRAEGSIDKTDLDDPAWEPSDYQRFRMEIMKLIKRRKSKRIKRRLEWETKKYLFECCQCQKSFADKDLLFKHENKHNKERQHKYNYKCGHCDYDDLFKSTFELHNMSKHNESQPYQCGRCETKFKRSHNLTQHIKFVHWKVRNYKCNKCRATFCFKKDLKKHLRTHLANKNPFKCKVCDKGFKQKSNLTIHQAVHSSEKPFRCDICGKRFKYKGNVRAHQKKLHNVN